MRVCICDDDILWLKKSSQIINNIAVDSNINAELLTFQSGESLIFEAEDIGGSIDLLIMDIKMNEMNGIETVKKIKEYGFNGKVVFVTVSNEHYADAFDLRAYNYVEKNKDNHRFEKVITDAFHEISDSNEEYVNISCAGISRSISLSSIICFEVNRAIITVHYGSGESMEFYSTMDKIEERLFGKGFIRVHRSFLVNKNKIRTSKYNEIEMANGMVIPVSRRKTDEIKEVLQENKIG